MSGLRASVRVAEFRALLGSYFINYAGDEFGSVAVALLVYARTGSAMAVAVLLLATYVLPALIGPAVVAQLDRAGLGGVLTRTYVYEAIIFGAMAIVANHGAPIPPIIALAFIDATLAFAGRSLTRAATAKVLVPHDLVAEGKAAFNFVVSGAAVAGPIAAGAVVALLSPAAALVIDSVSFLLAALIVASTRGLRYLNRSLGPGEPTSGRTRDGLVYVLRDAQLRALIVGQGIAVTLFFLVFPVTVVFAVSTLHAGAAGYAAILATWGFGMIIGAAVHVRRARASATGTILVSTLLVALGYLGTGVAPTLSIACVASVIGGIGNGMQWASVETRLHQLVDERFRVRVASLLEAIMAIAPTLGILIGGALTTAWSARVTYLISGLGLAVIVALGWLTGALGADHSPLSPSHSRQDGDLATVDNGRGEPIQEPNVLAPHVDVHEPA